MINNCHSTEIDLYQQLLDEPGLSTHFQDSMGGQVLGVIILSVCDRNVTGSAIITDTTLS
jgi:hypothetical protein